MAEKIASTVTAITLDAAELALVLDALDSHRYWQVAEQHQRNNGFVYPKPSDPNYAAIREVDRLEKRLERRAATLRARTQVQP